MQHTADTWGERAREASCFPYEGGRSWDALGQEHGAEPGSAQTLPTPANGVRDQESLHDPRQVSELIPAQPQNQCPEGHTQDGENRGSPEGRAAPSCPHATPPQKDLQSPRGCGPLLPKGAVKKGVMERGYERGARRGRKFCKGKTRQAKQEQLRSHCPSHSHPRCPADAVGARPAEQCRAANMIYFLAAIMPLSGACEGSAGAQAGANAISSGGSEIRRAPLGKCSSADRPWAGPGSTVPGHSLPSKGGDEVLWTLGTEAGSREGGSGLRPGVLSLAEASLGAQLCPPRGGDAAPRSSRGHRRPSHGAPPPTGYGCILSPRLAGNTQRLGPLWNRLRPGCPRGELPRAALCPQASTSANPAGRARVMFPRTPRLGPARGQRSVRVTPSERFSQRSRDSLQRTDTQTKHSAGGKA